MARTMSLKKDPLRVVRLLLGALFVFGTSALSDVASIHARVHGPLLGWPDAAPVHASIIALPGAVAMALAIARTIAAIAFAFGLAPRVTGLVAAALGLVALAQDPFGFTFTLEVMLAAVSVFAFADPKLPRSSVTLVRAFVASIYFWSAIPKLGAAWLGGDVLRAYGAAGMFHGALGALVVRQASAVAITTAALELTLPVLLFWRRSRVLAIVIACIMHTSMELALRPDVFGWLMVILLGAFWPADITRALPRARSPGSRRSVS
jgi:hypothetical protein